MPLLPVSPRRPALQLPPKSELLSAREEWCGMQRHFIPIGQLEKLVTLQSVTNALKQKFGRDSEQEIVETAAEICDLSKKLFTVLLCGAPDEYFPQIVEALHGGVTDKDLPFSRVELSSAAPEDTSSLKLGRKGHDSCKESDHFNCIIQAFSQWNEIDVTNLLRDQWLALAPVFQSEPDEIPHFDLDPNVVLPFMHIPGRKNTIQGGYGEVSQIKIHPEHQRLLHSQDSGNSKNPLLADKMLFSNDNKEFLAECDMLKAVTFRKHKHLVKLLATYKLHEKFHLLFLYANSNLRSYWYNVVPAPLWDKKTCIWSIRQMRGLASAIHAIHEFRTSQPQTSIARSKEPTDRRPHYVTNIRGVDPREELFGRHGDLKPENILLVSEDDLDDEYYLQIADFGLGRFHRFESRSRVDPKTVNGSASYMPPELVLEEPISRAYDIWSLGCVFLEFITWMLEGKQGLESFTDRRNAVAHDHIEDDTFFTAYMEPPKRAEVRPGVVSWINYLQQHQNCSGMIHDLLRLVQFRMLSVKTSVRIRSRPLDDELQRILNKAEQDEQYLLRTQPDY